MRVLITGTWGFLGSNVLHYLKQRTDWDLVTVDGNLAQQHIQSNTPYDVILNLASQSSVEKSIKEPLETIENNVMLITRLLEFAKYQPPKSFIHMSTVEAVRPTNPYAASKAAQEAIATAYRDTYDLPIVIVRSHNIVGQGQNPEKFVPKLVEKIKAGETIEIYGNGSRVYIPVDNVASALLHIIRHEVASGTYLISGGERLTNMAMAKKIANILDKPFYYSRVQGRPGYARALRGEGQSIPAWNAPQTLDEGLAWVR